MKIRSRFRYGKLLVVGVCLVSSQTGVLMAQETDTDPRTVTLPISSHITVAVSDSLHSSSARAGQEFGVVLTEPLTDAWGTIVVPAGTPATGRVLNVEQAGLVMREAHLLITLRAIQVGQQSYPIRTNSMNIEGGREGWITPLDVDVRKGRAFLFTLVAPLTLPIAP